MATSPYKYVERPDHPLAPPGGFIPRHRIVLWEKIGPGSHPCHRCGKTVTWMPGNRTREGSLVADHLDGDQSNNAPENLAPSCQGCNIIRARDAKFEGQLFIVNKEGSRELAEERECLTCHTKFLIAKKLLRPRKSGKKSGRYCSRRCMYDRNRK